MFKKLLFIGSLSAALLSMPVFAEPLPKLVFDKVETTELSSRSVKALVKEAAGMYYEQPEQARLLFVEALEQVKSGKSISNYEYLWVLYGLINSSYQSGTSEFVPGANKAEYIQLAEQTLDFLYEWNSTGYWQYTEEGQFQMEAHRIAANGLSWYLMEDATSAKALERANAIAQEATSYIRGPEDFYLYDTYARILLKQGKDEQAYKVVKLVLDEEPGFESFHDLAADSDYQAWAVKQKGEETNS